MKFRTRLPMPRRLPSTPAQFRAAGDAEVPGDFIEVVDCLPPRIDRQLGYFRERRFVTFRYESRAQDVIWQDEQTFGISTGAWQAFIDEIEPLAESYGVNLGSDSRSAEHVLVCDRVRLTTYLAPRDSAEAFLNRRRQLLPGCA